MTPEITWTGTEDDMTAIVGEYRLQVRFMLARWWYGIFYHNEQLGELHHEYLKSSAQEACINAYKQHIKQ